MSNKSAAHPDRLHREFTRFARRVRRRAWTIVFVRSWLPAAGLCCLLGAAIHVNAGVGWPAVVKAGALVSLIAAVILTILRRRTIDAYIAIVDRHYDAAGRIVAAAEFLRSAEPPDAFRKLAIEDAATWISKHPRRGLPWTLGRARRPAAGAALCLAAAMLVGCESPQPARPRPATEPDAAPPGPAQRAEPRSSGSETTGGDTRPPDRGEDGETPVGPGQTGETRGQQAGGTGPGQKEGPADEQAADTGPGQKEGPGDEQATGAGPGQAEEPGDQQATGTEPGQAEEPGDEQATGAGPGQAEEPGDEQAGGTEPGQAEEPGDEQATGAGPGQAEGTGDEQASGTGPGQAEGPAGEQAGATGAGQAGGSDGQQAGGGQGQPGAPNDQEASAESARSEEGRGGQQAGTETAEKMPDDREVDAPGDDVHARNTDEGMPDGAPEIEGVGPEVEGVGEEFGEGAAPAPQTQPVTPGDYRDARRQDLTRERVSPARRALIERYFQNLRQPTRRPTSRPTSRPVRGPAATSSRPAGKVPQP